MTLSIHAVQFDELTVEQIDAWSSLRRRRRDLASPFFTPGFARLMSRHRDDVEVGIISRDGKPVGFFPFHRLAGDVAGSIGGSLSSMQGLIAAPDLDVSAVKLLDACRLRAWRFDHLLTGQAAFATYHDEVDPSYFMDLRVGFDAYAAARREAGSGALTHAARKRRKIARDAGDVQLDWSNTSQAAFETFCDWKRGQLDQQGFVNTFRQPWCIRLFEEARRFRDTDRDGAEEVRGQLTTLLAGGELVAACLSFQSGDIYDASIPAYNPAYSRYSPGLLLHSEMAQRAAEAGIARIDLGRGDNQLKTSLATGSEPLAIGAVDRRRVRRMARKCWASTRRLVQATPLRGRPLAGYRRVRNWFRSEGALA